MISTTWRSSAVAILALAVVNMGFVSSAHAGIVGTETMVSTERAIHLATVQTQFSRADVREQFAKLGVSDAAVDRRVAALSDSELAALAKQMQDAPAGGDILVLIGATFVVLLLLELIGVIDIFKKA